MIGIIAPYSRCEATAAAIRIADLCLSYGVQVRLMSYGRAQQPVHDYWDRNIWSTRKTIRNLDSLELQTGVTGCDQIVTMQTGTGLNLWLTTKSSRLIVVPCWHHMDRTDLRYFDKYAKVVCPSKELHTFIKHHLPVPMNAADLTWTRFDTGMSYAAADHDGDLRVGLIVNGAAIDASGMGLLRCVETLLATHETLSLELLHSRSWPASDRRCLFRLMSSFQNRLTVAPLGSTTKLNQRLHRYDWCVIPSPRSDFGSLVARSLACGVPVVCYDVAPFNELVRDEHNGRLVRCELDLSDGMEAPVAVPATKELTRVCLETFADRRAWTKVRSQDWRIDEHQAAFNTEWAKILKLI